MENKPYPIKEILSSLLENIADKGNSIQVRIGKVWEEITMEDIGENASVIKFSNGILKVKVVNSSYFYQLTLLKNRLIKKLNERLGEKLVKDINFCI